MTKRLASLILLLSNTFWLSIFWYWVNLMKAIPETCCAH
jgi:hypothetical protein